MRIGAAVFSLFLITGCGESSSPNGPTPSQELAGTWVETIAYSLGAVGRGTATLTVRGPLANNTYEGTWSFVFPNTDNNRQGTLTTSVPREVILSGLATRTLDVEFALKSASTRTCAPPLAGFPPSYELRLALNGSRLFGESLISECGELFPGRVELARR